MANQKIRVQCVDISHEVAQQSIFVLAWHFPDVFPIWLPLHRGQIVNAAGQFQFLWFALDVVSLAKMHANDEYYVFLRVLDVLKYLLLAYFARLYKFQRKTDNPDSRDWDFLVLLGDLNRFGLK